jgi:hypothetical protein
MLDDIERRTKDAWLRCLATLDASDAEQLGRVTNPYRRREILLSASERQFVFLNVIEAEACGCDEFSPRPASYPCPDPPGSALKILAMATRVQNGEEVFHPLDRQQLTPRKPRKRRSRSSGRSGT